MSNSPLDVQSPGPAEEPNTVPQVQEKPVIGESQAQEQDSLGELRTLLLGSEVDDRLDAYRPKADAIAKVLPEAVELTKEHPQPMVGAMRETIEDSIKESINQDQEVLADTLFPIIGPATRKAVTTAIKTLTDSLNQGLELSLSPQSVGWRFESWRTGRPFAEVVLLRTLLFQVEQVLLIHKQTGLMLQDVVAETSATQDPELVSAMLTAIEDFVKDSFTTKDNGFLDTVEFGDLNLWIEDGPKAVIACVIRGSAPQSLRPRMQETLELIHKQFDSQLENFRGDREQLSHTREFLEACLQTQARPKPKQKRSPLFWISLFLLAGIFLFMARETYLQNKWQGAIEALEKEPGITIFKTHRGWSQNQIKGIRDPLSADPTDLLRQHNINPDNVDLSLEPYWSLSHELIEASSKAELDAPETVQFQYDPISMTLKLSGKAGSSWIKSAQKFPEMHPRVQAVDTSSLELFEEDQLLSLKADIEKTIFSFSEGSGDLKGKEAQKFQTFAEDIKQLATLSEQISFPLRIEIRGRSSISGQYEDNARLSQSRADLLMKKLIQKGIPARFFKAQGLSVKKTDQNNIIQQPQVDFYVNLKQP